MHSFFITGTDTEIGKTLVSCAIILRLQQRGLRIAAMKPIASGCQMTAQGLRNEDALALQRTAVVDSHYEEINPYAFAPAIAPHIAAVQAGVAIRCEPLVAMAQTLRQRADGLIVEGVGGWEVPINDQQSTADLAQALGLPVILVVGIRLGCINHALLSAAAIQHKGCQLAGWVANQMDPKMECTGDNITALTQRLGAPLLARIPPLQPATAEVCATYLDLQPLLSADPS